MNTARTILTKAFFSLLFASLAPVAPLGWGAPASTINRCMDLFSTPQNKRPKWKAIYRTLQASFLHRLLGPRPEDRKVGPPLNQLDPVAKRLEFQRDPVILLALKNSSNRDFWKTLDRYGILATKKYRESPDLLPWHLPVIYEILEDPNLVFNFLLELETAANRLVRGNSELSLKEAVDQVLRETEVANGPSIAVVCHLSALESSAPWARGDTARLSSSVYC